MPALAAKALTPDGRIDFSRPAAEGSSRASPSASGAASVSGRVVACRSASATLSARVVAIVTASPESAGSAAVGDRQLVEAGARLVEIEDPQSRVPYVLPYRFYLWAMPNPHPDRSISALHIEAASSSILIGALNPRRPARATATGEF